MVFEWLKFRLTWWPRIWWMVLQLIVMIITLVVMFPFLPYTPIPVIAVDLLDGAKTLKIEYLEECERLGFS